MMRGSTRGQTVLEYCSHWFDFSMEITCSQMSSKEYYIDITLYQAYTRHISTRLKYVVFIPYYILVLVSNIDA